MKKMFQNGCVGAIALALAAASTSTVRADFVTLTDSNTSVNFDTTSQAGMYDWVVDGVDHMFQQAFWYRVGNQGGELGVHTLTQTGIQATDTNFFDDPGLDTLNIRYTGNGFMVDIKYSLVGGSNGSGTSDVGEQIKITNTGNGALDFHFFQYNDYDLGGTILDNSVAITGGNTATQTGDGAAIGEVVVTPAPNQYAVGIYANQLAELNDANPTNLGAVVGPLGPGDLTWAFQWDVVIPTGGSFIISKDKHVSVPAPGAMLLGILGLGMARAAKRRLA